MHAAIVPPPVVPVYLVRTKAPKPTWYALTLIAPRSLVASTALVAFRHPEHAHRWAAGLEAYHREHGHFPSREFTKLPASFKWMPAPTTTELPPLDLVDVHKMSMADVQGMMKGSGLRCRVVLDPDDLRKKIDISLTLDRAATCARLTATLERNTDPRL